MKKNITINLFGTLYNIDEDAYQLLDNYLQSMKRYFSTKDDGEDIADDIEHRVAELLWEKKEQGLDAISIEIIKEIIGKIGNAEEIAGEETTENGEQKTGNEDEETNNGATYTEADNFNSDTASLWERIRHHFKNRRLFRDPDNTLLGGVCSGIANYIGFGDPILWRILLLALFFVEGVGLITYLILWIIIPLARTPEDKLMMKGKQLTPNNINEQIIQDHSAQATYCGSNSRSNGSRCLKVLFALFILGPLAFFILATIALITGWFGVIGGMGSIMLSNTEARLLSTITDSTGTLFLSGIVCVLIILAVLFILLLRWIFGSGKPMSSWLKTVIALLMMGCLIWGVFSISRSITQCFEIAQGINEFPITRTYNNKNNHTFDPQPHLDIPYLDKTGFTIITNTCNRCTWAGDYPTGDAERRYLDACDYNFLDFTAENTDTVVPGIYTLTALVRAEDEGAYLYIKVGQNGQYTENMTCIPANGNKGGNLWKWACGNSTLPEIKEFYPEMYTDSIRRKIAFANDNQGFGWQVITIRGIKVKKGEHVKYGITTKCDIVGKRPECEWVSATDFVLKKTN
ncbi:MAG: PspC domain-containing protein [Bacteroidaceae bacterium]|nr:PspC domain-containing protein [Bacteroidaceae bacterium]